MSLSAKRVMSGTFGGVYVDGELLAEISAFQAKHTFSRDDIQMAGEMAVDSKITNTKGTGSITLKKVYSRFAGYVEQIQNGADIRFTILARLADPDAFGAERVALYNVSFDEMTLMDWAVGKTQDLNYPFRFTRSELLEGVYV
ncbi:MAG: phage tail tube protein [Oscillospiraceae bacterium]|nr:phage tail tube protein [Oscillospiraceae bacterium]